MVARPCALRLLGVLCICAAAGRCHARAPAEPSGPPVSTNVVTITPAGVSPRDIQIALGDRVLFINSDGQSHSMASDPHPDHTDCPSINQVGFLLPGQRRETGNFVQARLCGFHDHDNPDVREWHGTITIK